MPESILRIGGNTGRIPKCMRKRIELKGNVINSVDEFHHINDSYRKNHPIFRGMKNESHDLITRFGRSIIENKEFREKNSTFSYILNSKKEIPVLTEFKNRSTPYLTLTPANDWEWLAIAQHHGLPTRMMDWTTNLLVAAYFAAAEGPKESDAAIYVIREQHKLLRAPIDQSPFKMEETTIFHPRHATPRITAQSGLFTVHPELEQPFNCDGLEKWILKKECIVEIAGMLRQYGISHASMFPGMEGVTALIREDYGL